MDVILDTIPLGDWPVLPIGAVYDGENIWVTISNDNVVAKIRVQ